MTKRKRWQRVITWIVGGMLLFLAAHTLVFPPQGVSAQEDGEEPNPIVLWYAETFGLTYAEAEHRLYLQEEMTLLQIRIMEMSRPMLVPGWEMSQSLVCG